MKLINGEDLRLYDCVCEAKNPTKQKYAKSEPPRKFHKWNNPQKETSAGECEREQQTPRRDVPRLSYYDSRLKKEFFGH